MHLICQTENIVVQKFPTQVIFANDQYLWSLSKKKKKNKKKQKKQQTLEITSVKNSSNCSFICTVVVPSANGLSLSMKASTHPFIDWNMVSTWPSLKPGLYHSLLDLQSSWVIVEKTDSPINLCRWDKINQNGRPVIYIYNVTVCACPCKLGSLNKE